MNLKVHMPSRVDLIMHQVRMRLLVALSGRQLTPRQLLHEMPDIAPATLYRHINALVVGGILTVVQERQRRSAIEKVFAIADQAARLTGDDLSMASKDDHLRYFTAFVTSLLIDFTRYIDNAERIEMESDGVRYNKGTLYLNEQELQQVQAGMRALLLPLLVNTATEERRLHIFATVLLPSVDGPSGGADQQ